MPPPLQDGYRHGMIDWRSPSVRAQGPSQ